MSDKILAIIDPEGDVKEQLQSIRDNFLTLQKDSLKGAAQVLAISALASNTSISGATFASYGLKTSITTSGGLVILYANVDLVGTGSTHDAQIVIDDNPKTFSSVSLDPAGGAASTHAFYAEALGAGIHIIDLQFKTNGSATLTGGIVPSTYLLAIEFIV